MWNNSYKTEFIMNLLLWKSDLSYVNSVERH